VKEIGIQEVLGRLDFLEKKVRGLSQTPLEYGDIGIGATT